MRVVEVTAFGGPEVLRVKEVPPLKAGPGQVVVDVAASGVLSVDAMIRSGGGGDFFPIRPPYVPGVGVGGTVTSVGDGVDGDWVGRRVVADIDGGGYAEQVLAGPDRLVVVPDELGLDAATALLHDGSGALGLLERLGVTADDTVLVQPATGGLGSNLVQLAHDRGATVAAAAGGPEKAAVAKELGADLVADYRKPGWAEELRAAIGGFDAVFTGVGGELGLAAFELTKDGGRFFNYGFTGGGPTEVDPELAKARKLRVWGLEDLSAGAPHRLTLAERVFRLAAEGRLRPLIGRTFPLEQAADAQRALDDRAVIGKALLVP